MRRNLVVAPPPRVTQIPHGMFALGIHLFSTTSPDAVHWQANPRVRLMAHDGAVHTDTARNRKTRGNFHEYLQKVAAQNGLAPFPRPRRDAAGLYALLQSAGSESRPFHGHGRTRRLRRRSSQGSRAHRQAEPVRHASTRAPDQFVHGRTSRSQTHFFVVFAT